ncbi:carbohydrate porin [Microcoleus sp. FACHB-1515]|uniref:iron uptake porin n=1 Tax=Cyanophyceae TaxID=3028117 RepID=UPI001689B86B|nr:iron uptake porin [Microcoleus sp. FACHB-1515]MBD2089436.1 carbohydrate porin [Microcoleus sp. FACHB-1515]
MQASSRFLQFVRLSLLGVWFITVPAFANEPEQFEPEAAEISESESIATQSIELNPTPDSALAQIPSVSQLLEDGAIALPLNQPPSPVLAQATSVSQLSDVQPTDWTYQALQALIENYGCIAGYPNGTFRGQQAITRFEFAAGLNACLDRINERLPYIDMTREDVAALERFITEPVIPIRGRIDALEARSTELEANQFSTTTRLVGETVFGVADLFGGETGEDNTMIFGSRIRLRFETSFTGDDQLVARLQWGNFNPFDLTATNQGNGTTREPRLSFDTDTNGNVEIDILQYRWAIDDSITAYLIANGADAEFDFTDTISPFDSSGTGAISRFGRRNPAVYRTPGNAGLGLNLELTDAIRLDLAYIAADADMPDAGTGLFNGEYSAFAQLTLRPIDRLRLGLTYVNAYYQGAMASPPPGDSGTGSALASLDLGLPILTNAYGAQINFEVSDRLEIGGWAGYTFARVINTGDAEIFNFAAHLGFPDLGGRGNLGGLIVGMQPRLQTASFNLAALLGADSDADTGLHLEAFYRLQLTDNVAITPGIVWLTAPNHDEANDDLVLGTIRTTFSF